MDPNLVRCAICDWIIDWDSNLTLPRRRGQTSFAPVCLQPVAHSHAPRFSFADAAAVLHTPDGLLLTGVNIYYGPSLSGFILCAPFDKDVRWSDVRLRNLMTTSLLSCPTLTSEVGTVSSSTMPAGACWKLRCSPPRSRFNAYLTSAARFRCRGTFALLPGVMILADLLSSTRLLTFHGKIGTRSHGNRRRPRNLLDRRLEPWRWIVSHPCSRSCAEPSPCSIPQQMSSAPAWRREHYCSLSTVNSSGMHDSRGCCPPPIGPGLLKLAVSNRQEIGGGSTVGRTTSSSALAREIGGGYGVSLNRWWIFWLLSGTSCPPPCRKLVVELGTTCHGRCAEVNGLLWSPARPSDNQFRNGCRLFSTPEHCIPDNLAQLVRVHGCF
ncbi:hypothetical protein N657DRAFT_650828 [Parathielavia appendiculata]|uniref:Uncharacterized protein n=1 Tax=Parathielavia appendiculata TaxID=2587402 RepID=A0AAN6YZX1_9PEZI|nr:hypothetical protein N657DRAFT_650828 [Parathielavia appendiculata]